MEMEPITLRNMFDAAYVVGVIGLSMVLGLLGVLVLFTVATCAYKYIAWLYNTFIDKM